MSANYKNWVPNGMIKALTAGMTILGAGTVKDSLLIILILSQYNITILKENDK